MKKRIVLYFLMGMTQIGFTQSKVIDSLYQTLTTIKNDSANFLSLMALADLYGERNRDSAIYFLDKAFILAKDNSKILDEAYNLSFKGYILMRQGKLSKSYQCLDTALKICKNVENEGNAWSVNDDNIKPVSYRLDALSQTHHFLGHLMIEMEKLDDALYYFNESKKYAESTGGRALSGMLFMDIGEIYLSRNELDSAIMFEESAARLFSQHGYKKTLSVPYVTIGNIFLKKGNNKQAVLYFHKSIEIAKEQVNKASLSKSYSALSKFYLDIEKNNDSSLYYAKRNLEVLQSMDSKELGDAYSMLSNSFDANNNIDSAYKYKNLAFLLKDSSYQAKLKNLTEAQNLSFEDQLKLKELEKEKTHIENKVRTVGMIAGLMILSLIGLFLYRNFKKENVKA